MRTRWIKLALGTLALGYVACLVSLTVEQRRFLYFPGATHVAATETDYALHRDGVTLRGWVLNPGADRALVYFGGNGDAIQNARADLGRWADGRTVYLLAYRGYGASEGQPAEGALFSDALALFDAVAPHHASVALLGRSLGSGVASFVAAHRPAERLILVTPFDSVARIAQARFPIFPAALLLSDKFESWRYAPDVHCPVLIVEAGDDQSIPDASTRRLAAAFRPPPAFITVAHADHNSLLDAPAYGEAVTAFLHPDSGPASAARVPAPAP